MAPSLKRDQFDKKFAPIYKGQLLIDELKNSSKQLTKTILRTVDSEDYQKYLFQDALHAKIRMDTSIYADIDIVISKAEDLLSELLERISIKGKQSEEELHKLDNIKNVMVEVFPALQVILDNHIGILIKQNAEAAEENNKLHEELRLQVLKAQGEALTSANRSSSEDISALKKELQNFKSDVIDKSNSASSEVGRLRTQLLSLEVGKNAVEQALTSQTNKYTVLKANLKKQSDLEDALAQAYIARDKLKSSYEKCETDYKNQVEQLRDRITEASIDMKLAQSEKIEVDKKLGIVTQERDNLKQRNGDLERAKTELLAFANRQKESAQSFQAKTSELNLSVTELKSQCKIHEKHLSALKEEHRKLQDEHDEKSAAFRSHQALLDILQPKLDAKNRECQAAQDKCESIETELAGLRAQALVPTSVDHADLKARNEIFLLKGELAQLKFSRDNFKDEKRKLESELSTKNQQLLVSQKGSNDNAISLTAAKEEIVSLGENYDLIIHAFRQESAKLHQANEKLEEGARAYDQLKSEKELEIKDILKKQQRSSSNDHQMTIRGRNSLLAELADLGDDNSDSSEEADANRTNLPDMKDYLKKLEKKYRTLEIESLKYTEQAKESNQSEGNTRSALAACQNELKIRESEKVEAQAKVTALERQLEQHKSMNVGSAEICCENAEATASILGSQRGINIRTDPAHQEVVRNIEMQQKKELEEKYAELLQTHKQLSHDFNQLKDSTSRPSPEQRASWEQSYLDDPQEQNPLDDPHDLPDFSMNEEQAGPSEGAAADGDPGRAPAEDAMEGVMLTNELAFEFLVSGTPYTGSRTTDVHPIVMKTMKDTVDTWVKKSFAWEKVSYEPRCMEIKRLKTNKSRAPDHDITADEWTACRKCIKSKMPCTMHLSKTGKPVVLPLPLEDRSANATPADLGYYIKQ